MKLQPLHRTGRFFSTAFGGGPSAEDTEWALAQLSDREKRLFAQMRPSDRAHSIAVAQAVQRHYEAMEEVAPAWVMPAALLHDVGKTVAGLGVYGRTVATLSGWVGGAEMAEQWADTTGFTRRVGLYMQYPRLGAELLEVNESDPLVVAWAAEHHLPAEDWTVPADDGAVLAAADDGKL
ncbi:MAG: HD domain-containing protein [Microthrixaceae bacterium]